MRARWRPVLRHTLPNPSTSTSSLQRFTNSPLDKPRRPTPAAQPNLERTDCGAGRVASLPAQLANHSRYCGNLLGQNRKTCHDYALRSDIILRTIDTRIVRLENFQR